jgi:hypothetical protein
MAGVLFEIWQGEDQSELSQVSQRGDELRPVLMPSAVMVHSFYAESDFQAFQIANEWLGLGEWVPPTETEEYFFSENEAEEQRLYLSKRSAS